MDRELILRWAKRLLVYLAGLFCMALGVVFSVKSALGVSPVTCLANVVYQITLTLPGGGGNGRRPIGGGKMGEAQRG